MDNGAGNDFSSMKHMFSSLLNGKTPNLDDLMQLKSWLYSYEPESEIVIEPDRDDLPVFNSKNIVEEASREFVKLEKNGFLLGQLPNFQYDENSFLHGLIFNNARENKFKWANEDPYKQKKGQDNVCAKGYRITSKGPGLMSCKPYDLDSKSKFSKLADEAESRENLPKYREKPYYSKFLVDFFNVFLEKSEICDIPYLIFNIDGLVDKKIKRVPAMSTFKFKEIQNIMKGLRYGNADGVKYPYVYYYFHCSFAGYHDEEYSMNSVNVNYGPGTKIWKILDRKYAHQLRELNLRLQKIFGGRLKPICTLQHKDGNEPQTLIHPGILALAGIPYKIVVQKPGTIIITSSAAMHAVLNCSRGVSVAQNLLIPINYLTNPITDMCEHKFETYDEMVQVKIAALLEVAKNPPKEIDPTFNDFKDEPIVELCQTEKYIRKLIHIFQHLKLQGHDLKKCDKSENCEFCEKRSRLLVKEPECTETGIKYAFYALTRLIKLSGLHIKFNYSDQFKVKLPSTEFSVPKNASTAMTVGIVDPFSAVLLDGTNSVPQFFICPANLNQFITLPVLCSEFDSCGDLVYTVGTVYNSEGSTIIVRKEDGSTLTIDVKDPNQICRAIKNQLPSEDELNIGCQLLYFFRNRFYVGVLENIIVDKTTHITLFQIDALGTQSKLQCPKNLLRTMMLYWFDALRHANPNGVPLVLPKKDDTQSTRKRTAREMVASSMSKNPSKKVKYTKGDLIEFEIEIVKNKKTFVCPCCSDKFTRKQSLTEHFYSIHAAGFPGYVCSACNSFFTNLKNYRKHNKTAHDDSQPPLQSWNDNAPGNNFRIPF